MRLKNLLLMIGSCVCIQAIAQETASLSSLWNTAIEPKLHPVKTSTLINQSVILPPAAQTSPRPTQIANPINSRTEGAKTKLDSVITVNPDGSNSTRQYFAYNEKGKEVKRLLSYWNATTNAWDEPFEEYSYEWSQDGYILSESVVGYGQGRRYEYVYNDKNWGIKKIIYTLEATGEWRESEKGEYTYDDAGNIIEEYIYIWDGGKWVNSIHNTATWDSKKRQTNYTSYTWEGTDWIGNTKNDYVWFDGPRDPNYEEGTEAERMTYKADYFWVDNKWVQYYIFLNKFNEEGRLIGQAEKYYNREFNNWGGGDNWDGLLGYPRTWESIITLDEHGNQTCSETKSCLPDSTQWISLGVGTYDWTYADNGDREGLYQSIQYIYDEEYNRTGSVVDQQVYYAYNADNKKTWLLQQVADENGDMEDLFEEKYTYNEQGAQTYSAVWDWVDGKRTPNISTQYIYNTDGELIETIGRTGENGMIPMGAPLQKGSAIDAEDEKGWVNSARWTYKYQNGFIIEKMGYNWRNSDWATNTGQTVEYEWNCPVTDMIVPEGWADPCKIDIINYYYSDGNGGWLISPQRYYYSEQVTGIRQTESGNITFAHNILTIAKGNHIENRVYDVTGKQVYQGNNSEENLNLLSKGIYVVRSTIDTKVFTLKIIIK